MAKPNYAFAKRQRDLAKKEKKLRKANAGTETGDNTAGEQGADTIDQAAQQDSGEGGGDEQGGQGAGPANDKVTNQA